MEYIRIGTKSARRASAGVLIGSTVTYAIMYSPQPLISLYSQEYGVSPATASLTISLTTVALAVSLLFVSMFGGIFARKAFMSGSLVVTSALTIAASFVHSFPLFLAIRLVEGISIAGYPSIAMAYLGEEFKKEDLGRVIGYYVAGNALGAMLGRCLIGTLTDLTNWHFAFLMQGVVGLGCAVWFWLFLPSSRNFTRQPFSPGEWVRRVKLTLFNVRLLPIYITGFLLMGAYVAVLDYIGYPLTRPPYNLSQTVFGFVFLVNSFGVLSSVLFGALADRYPRRRVLFLAIVLLAAGVLLTIPPSLFVKIVGVSLVAFGFNAGNSVASGWTGVLAAADCKGQASSFYLLFYYAGSSLVGWSGGLFLHSVGWAGLSVYLVSLLILAVFVACRPWQVLARRSN